MTQTAVIMSHPLAAVILSEPTPERPSPLQAVILSPL
jgi:hypothetical protein